MMFPSVLLEALRFQDPRTEGLRRLRDSEWQEILTNWRVVRLTLPLRRRWGEHLPEWVRSRIDAYLRDNAIRFERIKRVYFTAAQAFQEANVEHVVIKGFSLSPGYVEHPRFRPQSDIDLYCPEDSIFRARDALIQLGYQPRHQRDHFDKDHLPPMVMPTAWRWRGNYFDPDIPPSFELHSWWWDTLATRIDPSGLDKFWARRIERRVDEMAFSGLDAVDNLGYTALNLLRDLLRGMVATDQMYGLARFLHTQAYCRSFWRDWQRLHSDALRRLELISFRLVSDWFGCCLAGEVQEEIERLPAPVHSWFRYFSRTVLSPMFERGKDGLWLHLSLLERPSDKAYVLLRRLLPVPIRIPTFGSVLLDEPVNDPAGRKGMKAGVLRFCRQSAQYLGWYVRRTVSHLSRLPLALSRGLSFWLAERNLSH